MAKAKRTSVAKKKSAIKAKTKGKTKVKTKASKAKVTKSVRAIKPKKAKAVKSVKKKVSVKKKKVTSIPKGYSSVTPYLIIKEAAQAIEFYKKVFLAKELMRMDIAGRVGHAELKIGDAKVMLSDECPEMQANGPERVGGTCVIIHLYVKNSDEVVELAVKKGAKLIRPVETMFYGDRSGMIEDPFGHHWNVSTHVEDVTPAQLRKRMAAFNKSEI